MNFESQTDQDIRIYIEKELTSLSEQLPSLRHDDLSIIQETLQRKCQGIFLWVKLVMLELQWKYHDEGCSLREMEEILISIPADLATLYDRMFLKIESQTPRQRKETEAILAWIAKGTVYHDLMNDIIAIAACDHSELTASTLTRNRLGGHAEIEKRVFSRCVNFLEWTPKYNGSLCRGFLNTFLSFHWHVYCFSSLYAVTSAALNHVNHWTDSSLEFIHATAREFITTRLRAVDREQLVEDQTTKVAHFVATFDPSWSLLVKSWPKLQTEQLKTANLNSAVRLFDDLKVPMFPSKLDVCLHRYFFQDATNPTHEQELGPTIIAARIYFTLLLSAVV